jgi:hypothetical protein
VLPGAQGPAELMATSSRGLVRYAVEPVLPAEAGFGVLHFIGSRVIVPKGYRTVWVTAVEQ